MYILVLTGMYYDTKGCNLLCFLLLFFVAIFLRSYGTILGLTLMLNIGLMIFFNLVKVIPSFISVDSFYDSYTILLVFVYAFECPT